MTTIANIMANETCGSCKFKLANPQNINEASCRRYPPQLVVLPVQGHMNQMALAPMALYPGVHNKQPACGEWKPRLESLT